MVICLLQIYSQYTLRIYEGTALQSALPIKNKNVERPNTPIIPSKNLIFIGQKEEMTCKILSFVLRPEGLV